MSCYRLLSSAVLAMMLVACANVNNGTSSGEQNKITATNEAKASTKQENTKKSDRKRKHAHKNTGTQKRQYVSASDEKKLTGDQIEHSAYVESASEQTKAEVIFFRASVVASAVEAYLYELRDGRLYLISVVDNNTQIRYKVNSGRHTYMLLSGASADFIQVNAEVGTAYFTLVKPHMGAWKPSFSLWPIKHTEDEEKQVPEDELQKLLANTAVYVDEASEIAVVDTDILEIFEENWPRWSEQDEIERQLKTLNREDGRALEN